MPALSNICGSRLTSRLAVIAIVASFLSACTTASSSSCPPFPEAGPEVAKELEEFPFDGNEHFWDWMSSLDKLKDQLEACR